MISTFKFRMIVYAKITEKVNEKTLSELKDFRKNNWDTTTDFDTAYKKYVDMF